MPRYAAQNNFTMNNEILLWLNSDQNYIAGINLYDQFGSSHNLSRILRISGESEPNRSTLLYELSKIENQKTVSVVIPALEKPKEKQVIIKEEPPKLSEIITIEQLRSQQKMIYRMLDNLHAILPYKEKPERMKIAFQILDLDDSLKEITIKIEHFNKYGVIPQMSEDNKIKEISELDRAELILRQNNVRTYITRYTRLVSDPKKLKSFATNKNLLDKFNLELIEITERLNK